MSDKILAATVMNEIEPRWTKQYVKIVQLITAFPEVGHDFKGKKAPSKNSEEYFRRLAQKFASGRKPTIPKPPATVPDEMVSIILNEYFDIDSEKLADIKHEHALSMGAENIVGDLLERYIASVLEPHGWIWCAGAVIKAVDFIKAPSKPAEKWQLLQVKNRSNSENSSSSAIRDGTDIEKWFRCFCYKPKTNWDNFPDTALRKHLSEEEFKKFVIKYLKAQKSSV